MKISELAKRTGVSTHALRHYERLGLLEPVRHANGYRDYPESIRSEVVFIAMSRKIGFSLPAIAERLPTYRTCGCATRIWWRLWSCVLQK